MSGIDERIDAIVANIGPEGNGWGERTFTLAERMAQLGVPGVSVAVFSGGNIEWARGWGVRDESGAPVDVETVFQAASISKPVAAVAAMRLVEQGALALDADVNGYLRSWQVPEVDGWQPLVTLRQLLSHTAGLTVHGFPGYVPSGSIPTATEILNSTGPANTPPVVVDTLPGVQFRYSGGGYTVLQVLLEDVTGQPFAELARELVLEPLEMSRSGYLQPLPESWGNAASGHYSGGVPIPGSYYVMPELAAAGLWTTPNDLCRFAIGVRRAWNGDDGAILTQATAQEMLETVAPARDQQIALGFFTGGEGPTRRFGHGGSNIGYRCQVVASVEGGDGIAVMTNGESDAIVREVFQAIASSYGWDAIVPAPIADVSLADADLERLVGWYTLRPTWVATVTLSDGGLLLKVPGQPALPMVPVSDTEFRCGGLETRLVFTGSSDDLALEIRQAGESVTARRVG